MEPTDGMLESRTALGCVAWNAPDIGSVTSIERCKMLSCPAMVAISACVT